MTWLGKILTIVVMVVSLVWVYMTALAWSTRANWKTSADKYRVALDESEELRRQEYEDTEKEVYKLQFRKYWDAENRASIYVNEFVQKNPGWLAEVVNTIREKHELLKQQKLR